MSKLIGFGQCTKYYLYILYTVVLKAINDVIFGFSDIDQRNKEDFQIIKPTPLFVKHNLLQNLFRYLGFIIGGYIFLRIKIKFSGTQKSEEKSKEKKVTKAEIKLIYNSKSKYVSFRAIEIIIISSIFCIHYELRKFLYLMNFYFLDYPCFNVIFIVLFMHIYFKIEFYNYQKCSLCFIIITNSLLLLINSFLPQHRAGGKNEYDIYAETLGNAALCIPFLILFIILAFIMSYARVKIKSITTIKFISNYTIIIFIGIIGICFTIFEIIISENVSCNLEEMNETFQTLCLINSTDNGLIYHDEIKTFFVNFGNLSGKDIFINILLMIIYPILCFFEILCELLIIYYLDPIYILVRDNIYYFFVRIIFVMLRVNDDISDYITPRFFLHESSEIFAIIGYCIYLQLIELRFCNLDNDLNKNIIIRGAAESSILIPMKVYSSNDSDSNSAYSGENDDESERQPSKENDNDDSGNVY